jgi:hypothetical protein
MWERETVVASDKYESILINVRCAARVSDNITTKHLLVDIYNISKVFLYIQKIISVNIYSQRPLQISFIKCTQPLQRFKNSTLIQNV